MEAKGNSFECFCGIVDAFGETVGEMNIESIEDIWRSVRDHSSASSKLREIEPVTSSEPNVKPVIGFRQVGSFHEAIEAFFQCVGLSKFVGKAKHYIDGITFLLGEIISVSQQQLLGVFEIKPLVLSVF